MQIVQSLLVVAHMLGLAAIIGTFFVQMRAKSGFAVNVILAGAITQLVTGVALVGVGEAALDRDYNMVKITVKLVIALIVLVGAVGAVVAQKRGRRVQPWFHTAGGMAIVNVLVAALWH